MLRDMGMFRNRGKLTYDPARGGYVNRAGELVLPDTAASTAPELTPQQRRDGIIAAFVPFGAIHVASKRITGKG